MTSASEACVTPKDCALLLALPLDATTFEQAYLDPARDFCRQFTKGRADQPPKRIWGLMFEPSMGKIARLAEQVEKRGVAVTRNARLTDWTAALQRARVVTLVAHWRFTPITQDDILDARGIRGYAWARKNKLAELLDLALGERTSAADIAQVLDALCAPAVRRYDAEDRRGDPDDRGLNRVLLEQNLPGLRLAPTIELADRMYTVDEVIEATPMHYPGVIDLSVCNSILLAEALRRARDPLLIACGEFRADLTFRMVRYQVLIEALHRRAARFSDLLHLLTGG